MENQFIPYELSLKIKELGFDEPCLGYYTSTGYFNSKKELKWRKWQFSYNFQPITNKQLTWKYSKTENVQQVVAPLYQQALDWFREKGYENWVSHNEEGYQFVIKWEFVHTGGIEALSKIGTYEEAKLECLKKLIEIVKNK